MDVKKEVRNLQKIQKMILKAIRQKCLDCSGGQRREVELCPVTECDLYPYRFGDIPKEG